MLNKTIVPTCFLCLQLNSNAATTPIQFSLNGIVISETAGIIIDGHQLTVTKFTDLQQLNDGVTNSFQCLDAASILFSRIVTTLGKDTHVY